MFHLIIVLSYIAVVTAGPATESFKDQFCTDPRTMKKHAAYTEWADAYSCSRHRCQPGGRNLAIYTVGCKRVEAPESAIECEEVVEDTNMQFPYCCTRLRCLVVVRGEVWTRVLGQPWETLPAAPWSHMYKMKKPPPSDDHFGNKNIATGPVYEIQTDVEQKSHDKMLRSSKKVTTAPDCDEPSPRAAPAPAPDIVIALSTANDEKEPPKSDHKRHKRVKKPQPRSDANEENRDHNEVDFEDTQAHDKLQDTSDEKLIDAFGVTQSIQSKAVWTDIPQSQWDEHDPAMDVESQRVSERNSDEKKKKEKPSGLQALVDAIGNRMKDIENVVQRMTEKVHNKLPEAEVASSEKRSERTDKHTHKADKENAKDDFEKAKQPNSDNEHYKRFTVKNRGSKYLHGATDVTSEQPLFVEDTNLNGYFSDASNSVVRRAGASKEPLPTYMAPVESRRKSHAVDLSGEDKKHKKRGHKKKRKNKGHKKHHVKDDKRKRFNKLSSAELDKNVVSLEDSGVL